MFGKKRIEELEKENKELRDLINFIGKQQNDPKYIVKACFDNGIEWFDYEELPEPDRQAYYNEAQLILRSKIFSNEKNYLIATGAQTALLDAMQPQQLRDFQMTINGLQLFENRLREIKDPNIKESKENLHEAL